MNGEYREPKKRAAWAFWIFSTPGDVQVSQSNGNKTIAPPEEAHRHAGDILTHMLIGYGTESQTAEETGIRVGGGWSGCFSD